jgi:7-keto-8-aminopelargonate synthetase-like enzyme
MATAARARERLLDSIERSTLAAQAAGVIRIRVEDEYLEGHMVTVDGRRRTNFGSCAYLGLNLDQRLKDGATRAIERFGPVFSSSTVYTSAPLFIELESQLRQIFGTSVVVPATTTLGHLGALPVLIGSEDAVVIDAQTHATVHLATQVLAAQGVAIHIAPHNAFDKIESKIDELAAQHRTVWFLADGIYSMVGDVIAMDRVHAMLERTENLRVYLDDAHGVGWQGRHGRGHVLNEHPFHPRMVVAASLSKSFGSGGAVLALPNPEEAQRVQLTGGTLMFSGPLHPAELGAAIAAAEIHLSDEHVKLQRHLYEQIEYVRLMAAKYDVPLVNSADSPIWFARSGSPATSIELARRMLDSGYYVNIATYPAVAAKHSGVRFTNTLYHSPEDIEGLMEALAENLRAVQAATGQVDLSALD